MKRPEITHLNMIRRALSLSLDAPIEKILARVYELVGMERAIEAIEKKIAGIK